MKKLVIYHADCPDGFAAAWACWKAMGEEAEYFPAAYHLPPPRVDLNTVVFMVDFCYKPQVLEKMAEECHSVHVLDHHISAQKEFDGYFGFANGHATPVNLFAHFDMTKSGATLAWDVFCAGRPAAERWLVDYAEDRDLWKNALPHTLEVNALLQATNKHFAAYDKVWKRGLKDFDSIIDAGTGAHAWLRYYVEMCKRQVRYVTFAGHENIPLVNAQYPACSELGNEISVGHKFGVVWRQVQDGSVVYSLRSHEFDVSKLAQSFGGGGHKLASGFSVSNVMEHLKLIDMPMRLVDPPEHDGRARVMGQRPINKPIRISQSFSQKELHALEWAMAFAEQHKTKAYMAQVDPRALQLLARKSRRMRVSYDQKAKARAEEVPQEADRAGPVLGSAEHEEERAHHSVETGVDRVVGH